MRSYLARTQGVVVKAQAPLNAQLGSHFSIIATATNQTGAAKTLQDIDVADEYLQGIAIEGTDPPFKTAEHIPLDDTVSHHFELVIPPHGTVTVRFSAYAAHVGDYSGDFDFCIDGGASCSSYALRTIIRQ
jgi:hypothetical protein